VLRDDGTLWVNIGDSYNGSGKAGNRPEYQSRHTEFGKPSVHKERFGLPTNIKGLKPKDLIGIPWMLAFALRADGWYLRQDIIWAKPNPMPESVTDRCTKSHEYIFLLSKSKQYYYDAEAISEKSIHAGEILTRNDNRIDEMGKYGSTRGGFKGEVVVTDMRNKRSVWTVSVNGFKEAHFATFPQALIEPCILAGAPMGGLVLDPFTGSGTTGVTALQNGRNFMGIELNPKYVRMAEKRIKNQGHYQERIEVMVV